MALMYRLLIIATVLALSTPKPGLAADPDILPPGARIRVTFVLTNSPSSRTNWRPSHRLTRWRPVRRSVGMTGDTVVVTGTYLGIVDSTITVQASRPGRSKTVTVPLQSVTDLEFSIGDSKRKSGALRGLGYGAAVGVALGLLVASDPGWLHGDAGPLAGIGAISFGIIGAAVGALVSPGEQWVSVPPMALDIGLSVGGEQNGCAFVCLRF